MIKVAIVDDSRTARVVLRQAMEKDPALLVVGEAATGAEAMQLIKRFDPDLITMDIYLDKENGLDVAAWIMSETPRPIIAITGVSPDDPKLVYKALERGVLEVFPKLPGPENSKYERQCEKLVRLIKSLAAVPVLHLSAKRSGGAIKRGSKPKVSSIPPPSTPRSSSVGILLIGASTGGPAIVCSLLEALPKPCPVPVVVVQHISESFGRGFAVWLEQSTGRKTILMEETTNLESNVVYVAPDSRHIKFTSVARLTVVEENENSAIVPSIDMLFESGAKCYGSSAMAVLLTGMGRDGANGMKSLHESGAYTLVQSPETCAVDSMPRNAIDLKAVDSIADPDRLSRAINSRLRKE